MTTTTNFIVKSLDNCMVQPEKYRLLITFPTDEKTSRQFHWYYPNFSTFTSTTLSLETDKTLSLHLLEITVYHDGLFKFSNVHGSTGCCPWCLFVWSRVISSGTKLGRRNRV